jgi:hypothetical protein
MSAKKYVGAAIVLPIVFLTLLSVLNGRASTLPVFFRKCHGVLGAFSLGAFSSFTSGAFSVSDFDHHRFASSSADHRLLLSDLVSVGLLAATGAGLVSGFFASCGLGCSILSSSFIFPISCCFLSSSVAFSCLIFCSFSWSLSRL